MSENSVYIIILTIYVLVLGPDFLRLLKLVKKPPRSKENALVLFRLHLTLLIISVCLSFFLILLEVNLGNYSSPLEYSRIHQISLKNFDGLKRPGQKLQGRDNFAFITTNIEYETSGGALLVKSYFHPARSYVYIDNLESNSLLQHELYHFHVTELHARKLREEIKKYSEFPSRHDLKTLFEISNKEKDSMQMAYDFETDHGFLLGKQLFWQSKIDSLLVQMEDYSDPVIQF